MERRDLLKMIAAATGMSMIGGAAFAYGKVPLQEPANDFTEADVAKLDELAETIIPQTSTPGAKEAGVGLFMAQFVTDCYSPEEQAIFREGLTALDADGDFMALTPEARKEMLIALDAEAKEQAGRVALDGQSSGQTKAHYFTMMKQLTLFSFFTSEVGATKVLRYVAVPGRYDGELPYEQGTPAWAT
ncbi:gluconate 2-dehydrogenase subunit 3 family protein [Cereibacter sp. SYSU M97828]|nr:gluconate 2-dehydrogenase subunit 3 family protein [Cereibacter flavus]